MKSFQLFPLLALAGLLTHAAADPQEPPPSAYTAECQMVTISGKLIPALVSELNDESKAAAAVARLQEMIVSGEATLTAHLSVRGATGTKTVAESVEEVRYPTEFENSPMPEILPKEPSADELKKWPEAAFKPVAFDTRNVGQTMEIEAQRTANPKLLSVSYVVQHVRLEKMVKFDAGRVTNGERLFVEQPYFSTMKDGSNTSLEVGQSKLIGAHRLPGAEGVYELFLMTLRLVPAKGE